MKDLDFDELDRAVSTLMNDVPKSDLSKNDDDETKTLSINPTLSDNATPEPASVSEPVAAAATPQSRSMTPPAARRGGRFMDVVHHSSDMKKDKPASAQSTSRQGVTINPTKNVSPKDETFAPIPTSDSNPVAPTPQASDPVTTDTSSLSSDWPDPLDMSTPKFSSPDNTNAVASQPDAAPPLLEEGSETPAITPDSDDLQPLTSPFLSGTKVEKRPLGSAQLPSDSDVEAPEPDHTPVMSDSESQLTVDNPQDQLPADPSETKKDLPPELQGDLVAIESGASTQQMQPQEPTAEASTQPEPKPEASHPAALLEATTEDQPEFTGPTSIAQQYKEEPSTGDPKNGAIYDTDTYHKPLTHPAQKKSGWLWVIWIVLILLIGAGAGAALYFLRII